MPGKKFGESVPDVPDVPGEPEGWRELQERARRTRDPKQLEAIIAEMNQLLSECEKKAAGGKGPRLALGRRGVKATSIVTE
jgi:hypothetical protein